MASKPQKSDYYLGDENLPSPDTKFEYTPHMVKEMTRCMKDITYFAQKYFYITTLEHGKQKIQLYAPQKRLIKSLVKNRLVITLASRQVGKALDLNTPLKTPTGWKNMGDIKDGDLLYDEQGNICSVIKAHDILYNRNCYKITFSNGEEIIADEDHNWFTQKIKEKEKNIIGSVKTTKQILNTLYKTAGIWGTRVNHKIIKAKPLSGNKTELPIDPYILGLWLGDGSRHSAGEITVGSKDINEIMLILKNKKIDFNIREKSGGFNDNIYYSIYIPKLQKPLNKLKLFGHCNKHIPKCYMDADLESRKELLQGLLDSDGTITGKFCDFCNSEKSLIDSVEEFLWTMGVHKVTITKRKNYCNNKRVKDCYHILFKIDFPGFKLQRKLEKQTINFNTKTQYIYIKKIEQVSSRPVRCITVDSPNNLFLCGKTNIVTHNTTMTTIYALWNTCFNNDKRVLVVANKEDTAIMILRRIRTAYEQLPNWLKPGVKQWGKTEVVFGNDSSISISTTTSSAARGESCNVLIIDEMAFIPEHIMQEFWNSVIPIISSALSTKVFVVSTPNGTGNMFHRIYSGAERGDPKLAAWHHERIDWWEIPGRGKKWKLQMESALVGEGKSFDQEFGNVFLETGQSAVDAELLNHFRVSCRAPKLLMKEGAYKIWEMPDPEKLYVIGVDVGEGIGQAASVAQILDVTDLTDIKQVGCYHNNTIDPYHFAGELNELSHQWGMPQLLIERNNCGGTVIDTLKEVHHYNNIVDYTPEKQQYYNKLGIYSHTNAKYRGVINMRYWVNSLRVLTIYDISLVQELETFVKYPNGTWKKQRGDYIFDDRVLSLVWGLFALEPEIAERYFDIVSYDNNGKPAKITAIDVVAPEYFKLDPFYQKDPDAPMPAFFGMGRDDGDDDMVELQRQGWKLPWQMQTTF